MYDIKFYSEVFKDLDKMSNKIASEAREYFKKYKKDPYKYSQELQNLGKLKLQGYRKTYLAKATHRIVFKIEEKKVKIIEIVAVGKRENLQVYKDAFDRVR
jgi:mRNA interferase RelE/StbE